MIAPDDQRRPVVGTGVEKVIAATSTTVPRGTDVPGLTREQFVHWHGWLADSYDVERERLAFAVLVRTSAGTYRRRLYLALDSAYRAIERAEWRGVEAHAVMVELRQVGDLR